MKLRALFFLFAFFFIAPVAHAAVAPTCSMTTVPSSLVKGASFTLKWTSTNATSAVIPGPGLGNVKPIDQRNLIPVRSTRFIGTFTGPGGKAVCEAIIVVFLSNGSATPVVAYDDPDYDDDDEEEVGAPGTTSGPSTGGSTGTINSTGTFNGSGASTDSGGTFSGPSTGGGSAGTVNDPGTFNGSAASTEGAGTFGGPGTVDNPGTFSGPAPSAGSSADGGSFIQPGQAPKLSGKEGTGLVPCGGANDPTGCQACHLATLAQRIVNFLIGLSIPLAAAAFAYAGVIYFTSSVFNKIEKAKKVFSSVFIGFCIVVGAWVIVQTLLNTILRDSYKGWNEIQCVQSGRNTTATIGQLLDSVSILNKDINTNAQAPVTSVGQSSAYGCDAGSEYAPDSNQCISPSGQVTDAKSKSSNLSFNTYNGSVQNSIDGYFGTNTTAGPDGGNLACAWAVNNVLSAAGVPSIDGNAVEGMKAELDGGRGKLIDPGGAQKGDIVIWKEGPVSHVGFCYDDGCSKTVSNGGSRGNASFTRIGGLVDRGVVGKVYQLK